MPLGGVGVEFYHTPFGLHDVAGTFQCLMDHNGTAPGVHVGIQ